ncbi:hypothetical protein ERC79_02340 [Rhodococcus sp. ABRD24]|nr:hypothetical protein ERC79_02340 [Rhodococcus sp. ABRD24]
MSCNALRRRGAATVAAIPVAFVMSFPAGLSTAGAAPTDTVLPVPVVGLATGPTGFPGPPVAQRVTARTDPAAPGTTLFLGTEMLYCACAVHWRNVTTGATGVVNLWTQEAVKGESAGPQLSGSRFSGATVSATMP